MAFFDRFRAPLPEVAVDDRTRDAIAAIADGVVVRGASPQEVSEGARVVVEEHLLPPLEEFMAAGRLNRGEVGTMLYVAFWGGCGASIAEHRGWEVANAALEEGVALLREYVPFIHREEYDKGPMPLIIYATATVRESGDAVRSVLGVMAQILCVAERKGGLEGWLPVGLLAWMAGEIVGEAIERSLPAEESGE